MRFGASLLPSLPASVSDISSLRDANLERQRAERETDWLGGMTNQEDRIVVASICAAVVGGEERMMCQKRGARLSKRLAPYETISRTQSEYLIQHHRLPHDEHGVRVFIVEGKIHSWETFNAPEEGVKRSGYTRCYLSAAIGVILEGIKGGISNARQTFDVVVLFTDASRCAVHGKCTFNSAKPPPYPVVTYSASNRNCPKHIPLAWMNVLQDHRARREPPRWEDLKPEVLLRGQAWNAQRFQLAFLTQFVRDIAGVKIDVRLQPFPDATNRTCIKTVNAHIKSRAIDVDLVEAAGGIRAVCALDPTATNRSVFTTKSLAWDDMVQAKYLLAVDGYGATARFPFLMKASGVVLGLQVEYEESYFPDVIPFVHYLPLTHDVTKLEANLSATLSFLQQNDNLAKNISDEATLWVTKHRTRVTDQREWKLYFALMARRWEAGATSKPANYKIGNGNPRMALGCTYFKSTTDAGRGALDTIQLRMWEIICNAEVEQEGLRGELLCELPRSGRQWMKVPFRCFLLERWGTYGDLIAACLGMVAAFSVFIILWQVFSYVDKCYPAGVSPSPPLPSPFSLPCEHFRNEVTLKT